MYQSVDASSASAATACSMRTAKRRESSPSSGRNGAPNVTRVRDGRGVDLPLRRMRPVPSRCTGTTATPHRMAR